MTAPLSTTAMTTLHPHRAVAGDPQILLDRISEPLQRHRARLDHPGIKAAREALDRRGVLDGLVAQLHDPRTSQAALDSAAQQLYRDEIGLDKVIALAALHAAGRPSGAALAVVQGAQQAATAAAVRELQGVGDDWIVQIIRPALTPIAAGMVELAGSIGEPTTPETRDRRDAMTRLRDLTADFEELSGVADRLRQEGLIPISLTRLALEYRWRNRDELPPWSPLLDPLRWHLEACRGGAGPDCLTDGELAGREQAAGQAATARA